MTQKEVVNGATAEKVFTVSAFKPQLIVEPQKVSDAVTFYKSVFGAVETAHSLYPNRKADQELPHVLSAELKLAGSTFVVSDVTAHSGSNAKTVGANRAFILLETDDVDAAVAKAVAVGSVAIGEVSEVGKITDPFGVTWIFTLPAKKTDENIELKRAEEEMWCGRCEKNVSAARIDEYAWVCSLCQNILQKLVKNAGGQVEELTEREREIHDVSFTTSSNEEALLCNHTGCQPFRYRLCESCYNVFTSITDEVDAATTSSNKEALLCNHTGCQPFRYRLCESCYNVFTSITDEADAAIRKFDDDSGEGSDESDDSSDTSDNEEKQEEPLKLFAATALEIVNRMVKKEGVTEKLKSLLGEDSFDKSVRIVQTHREKKFSIAKSKFRDLSDAMGMGEGMPWEWVMWGDDVIDIATRYFTVIDVAQLNKGNTTELVHASCLYLACRKKNIPFLLIDFASYYEFSVTELVSVYWKLCEDLHLVGDQTMEDFIDPSVYIPSLSKRVFEGRHDAVMKTARDIIATMKRDWIETGLELVGICAAALYTAALSNGFNCSTTETEKQEKPPATALEAVCKLILQRLKELNLPVLEELVDTSVCSATDMEKKEEKSNEHEDVETEENFSN